MFDEVVVVAVEVDVVELDVEVAIEVELVVLLVEVVDMTRPSGLRKTPRFIAQHAGSLLQQ